MKRVLSLFTVLVLTASLLMGCNDSNGETPNSTSGGTENAASTENSGVDVSTTDMFTDRDCTASYDESTAVKIELTGSSATASSDTVEISGSTVTITEEATYIISGTLDDGMIIVNAPDTAKLQLVFDGVDITSSTSAPLYILEADKVFVTLVGENSLSNGGSFEAIDENNIDAVVFSKQDLTFNGDGSLTVSSPAGHGIVGKDDLVFVGGTYTVTSSGHAIAANDSVRVREASLTGYAGKDGIHAENTDDTSLGFVYIESGTITIEAEGDGISAGAYVLIEDGTFDILAGGGYENGSSNSSDNWGNYGGGMHGGGMNGGGRTGGTDTSAGSTDTSEDSSTSMKGIKATGNLQISGGVFNIDSADDAIHSNASITVDGGTFELASGDDAVHAEASLSVCGGTINITQSYEGLEALAISISGGDIQVVASDDGVNAAGGTDSSGTTGGRDGMFGGGGMGGSSNGSIVISGGNLYISASGDGIDSNGSLEITGGYTVVVGPTQGDTSVLDYDTTGTISGGTLIGTGASSMAQSISGSGQGVVAISVGTQSAGTAITLTDASGNEIISFTPELSFQIVILSSPDIVSGETYTVTVGTSNGEFEAQ